MIFTFLFFLASYRDTITHSVDTEHKKKIIILNMARPSLLSLTAFTFSLAGLILTVYSTVAPFWTKDDPSQKVNKNSEIIVEGLWLKCTIQVLQGKRSCERYDEFILDATWELLASRLLCVLAIIIGIISFTFSILGQDCVLVL